MGFCQELLYALSVVTPCVLQIPPSHSHQQLAPQPSSTTKTKVTSPVFRFCRVIALPPFSQQLKQKLPSLAGNPQTCYCSVPFALLSPGPSSTHFFHTCATEHRLLMLPAACSRFSLLKPAADSFLALQHLPRTCLTPGIYPWRDERKLFCKVLALAHVTG